MRALFMSFNCLEYLDISIAQLFSSTIFFVIYYYILNILLFKVQTQH